jgi:hypothetical protein
VTEFTCAACQGQFTSGRDEKTAQVEAEFLWDKDYLEEAGSVVICEDCWQLNFPMMMDTRLKSKGEHKN